MNMPSPAASQCGTPLERCCIEKILEHARWAPSGDNVQPWRFEIIDDSTFAVHLTNENNIFDYDIGAGTLMSAGALLESIRLAASQLGRNFAWSLAGSDFHTHRVVVQVAPDAAIAPDPLARQLELRSVDRNWYRRTPLTPAQKAALTAAVGEAFGIIWYETAAERAMQAKNNALATDIRMSIPETFATHQVILDWQHRFSPDKIPVAAAGVSWPTAILMRWLMKSWARVNFINTYMGGLQIAKLEMGILPSLFCGAHFLIYHRSKPEAFTAKDYLHFGQVLQRFWLTATAEGLVMQPSYATMLFALFGERKTLFSSNKRALANAERLAQSLSKQTGMTPARIAFMGRLGLSRSHRITARSVRLPLGQLMREAPNAG
jgi:sulfur-carrier protein adenylyltransferase/sulfurtransferase